MIRKFLALTLIIVPLALVACGDDEDSDSGTATAEESSTVEATTNDSASSGGGETVSIAETEFALDPADPTVKAGSVTFDVSNDGGTVHNLEVEGNGVEEVTDALEPGAKGSLTVDLEPGSYELYCSIGDHRDQGMEGTLTVE